MTTSTMSVRRPAWAYALMGVGVVAVSFSAIFIKMTTAPAAVTAMYRMWMTACLLAPFAWRGLWREINNITVRERVLLACSGSLLAVHFILWMSSLFYTSVGSSTLMLSLQPIFALLGGLVLFSERVRKRAWLFASIAVAGTGLIGLGDVHLGGTAALGDVLSLLGASAAAGYMLVGQRLRPRMASLHYSFLVYIIAGVVLLLYNGVRGYSIVNISLPDWRAFVLLTLVPTVLGHTVFNTLLKYLPASTLSMSIVGEPLGATLLAYVFFGQTVTWLWYVGAILIVYGVVSFLRSAHASSQSVEHAMESPMPPE